jgi:hypothetical protein
MSEYQKAYNEIGRLNHELIFTKWFDTGEQSYYPKEHYGAIIKKKRCICHYCEDRRKNIKRKVNKLLGRKFYKDV